MNSNSLHNNWTIDDAIETYGISNWGAGYFDVSSKGEVMVIPEGKGKGPKASLMDVISGLKERGMDFPILLRFEEILASRIKEINESFKKAIQQYDYQGVYRGVYPIKVNQQQQVLEEVTNYGSKYHHGLEAGSKAELIAAMSYLKDPEALLICNGYKDQEFIDLALYAQKLGIVCIIVIETLTEVSLIIERSKALKIKPILGVRMKLSSKAGGHWKESGGDRSVFGLNTAQLMRMVDQLKKEEFIDCLKLLHYHLGSQIPNIRDIRGAAVEACRIYCGLVKEGASMGMLDFGGGLAVDYDGSHTNSTSSCNYSIDEYSQDIVEVVCSVMNEAQVVHPTLITESGRATVAYYSVLLFNVLDISRFADEGKLPSIIPENAHELTRHIYEAFQTLTMKNIQENYHDAIYYRDEIRELFKYGKVSIRERGLVESIFWHMMVQIAKKIPQMRYVPDDFSGIEEWLADTYYGNLSIFQSLPDAWAIDQVFPVMPIHHLKKRPTRKAIIADITCDCDGKLNHFIDFQDLSRTLLLHDIDIEKEDYYLGVFLVGAYQETLGDLHNLMGDTNVVSIRVNEGGTIDYVRELEGDSVKDVLAYVEYDEKNLRDRFRQKAEQAVRAGKITPKNRREMIDAFNNGLQGYTYYEQGL